MPRARSPGFAGVGAGRIDSQDLAVPAGHVRLRRRRAATWPVGRYATHLYLAPDALLLRVPQSIGPVVATVVNPLGAGLRWGVEVPGTTPGDIVAVLGPGIRGLAASAAAKAAGAGFVMTTGLGARDASRLELAPSFGADVAVDVGERDPVRSLVAATGRLADVVIDVTAKAPSAPGQALRLVLPGGLCAARGGHLPLRRTAAAARWLRRGRRTARDDGGRARTRR